MSDYCMLFSQTFYGLLFSYRSYHYDVTSYVDHTVHLTKSLLQTVLQMLLSQKNNSCTLCVPMFSISRLHHFQTAVYIKVNNDIQFGFASFCFLAALSSQREHALFQPIIADPLSRVFSSLILATWFSRRSLRASSSCDKIHDVVCWLRQF